MVQQTVDAGAGIADLLSNYRVNPGSSDELLAPDGTIKPAWREFISHLAQMPSSAVADRFARGDRYLRDAGVLFRRYDDKNSTERDWPLSHIPVILDDTEWGEIAQGLIQRADLLEAVARDVYGKNELVAAGHLPASLIAQNPAWLRPLVGVEPRAGNYLNFLSFEIGRGPNGKWWVLSDMTETVSSAGFAIENRVATSRVFSSFFDQSRIHRIAGFFQAFQNSLFDLRGSALGQIAILSPGVLNDSYFEHAYIARYLGLLLVEGEDLVVQDQQVMVRTVAGLQPVNLLWRRLAGPMCDPLELTSDSQLGTPGLVDVVRNQNVNMINALGVGVLETRALMAFLPKICRSLTGEQLSLPNIATWWCGQESERAHVLKNQEKMMIGSAYSTRPLIEDIGGTFYRGSNQDRDPSKISELLSTRGRDLVGQEAVTLSTSPVWNGEGLTPKPMCLRVFLARTSHGWEVMQGGYARVSAGEDAAAFAMQRGGKVADVWIVSGAPVAKPSLPVNPHNNVAVHALDRALPSRAADNLFWLGRYVERAEYNMRIFRAYYARRSDGLSDTSTILEFMRERLLGGIEFAPDVMAKSFEEPLAGAMHSAERVSDRVSVDGMMALKDLAKKTAELSHRSIPNDEKTYYISILLRRITGFAGLVHENMYRSLGWRFLSSGVSLERAANMATLLAELTDPAAPDGALDLALELGDSAASYRMRYSVAATPQTALDILALDGQNPRSLLYHVSRLKDHISEFPGSRVNHRLTDVAGLALKLETAMAVETTQSLTPGRLLELRSDIWTLSELLSAKHLQ